VFMNISGKESNVEWGWKWRVGIGMPGGWERVLGG